MSFFHVARDLNFVNRQLESFLQKSEVHSSELWFAWGLIDVRIQQIVKLLGDIFNPQFQFNWSTNIKLLENDFQHLHHCIQRNPLESKYNVEITNICVKHLLMINVWLNDVYCRKRKNIN